MDEKIVVCCWQVCLSILIYLYYNKCKIMERQARRMIQQLFDNHVFLYIMGGLCGLGVFLKCFLLVVYNKLIAASENMSSTKKNWLKNMKLRFESSYQLQLGVNDVDIYVDKYVSKIKYGGLLLSTWENISGQTIGLCLLTGSFAGIIGFVYDCGQSQVLFTFFAGAWTAIIVNIVDNVVNISAHRQMLRYNLIDYFENNLKVRMEQEVFHPEVRKKYQREYFEDSKEQNTELRNIKYFKNEMEAANKDIDLDEWMDKHSKNKLKKHEQKNPSSKRENLEDMEEIVPELLSKSELKHMAKINKKESKRTKEQDKLDAKQAKKQAKLDLKQAKKQEKLEGIQEKKQAKIDEKEARKQAKIDEKEAKKQAKLDRKKTKIAKKQAKKQAKRDRKQRKIDVKEAKKQAVIEAKREKKQRQDEEKEAKERAELKAYQAKKRAKEEEKEKERENKVRIELERKQKTLKNNKAYIEKMRLMEDKEREAKKREEFERMKEERLHTRMEGVSKTKQTVKELELLNDENYEKDRDSLEMTAISKEEDLLIEEVLKDFLS